MVTLFFASAQEVSSEEITISGEQGHHAISVLRVKKGAQVRVGDGHGHWAQGAIIALGKNSFKFEVEQRGIEKESALQITVAQALLKGESQKVALNQLVQSGVDRIIPWSAERSIGKSAKWEKWQGAIISAAQQSRRAQIPALSELHSLQQLREIAAEFQGAIALHESGKQALTSINFSLLTSLLVIVGPEGGLSEREVELLSASKIAGVKMGAPVIRADLAGALAIAAISALTARWA